MFEMFIYFYLYQKYYTSVGKYRQDNDLYKTMISLYAST